MGTVTRMDKEKGLSETMKQGTAALHPDGPELLAPPSMAQSRLGLLAVYQMEQGGSACAQLFHFPGLA